MKVLETQNGSLQVLKTINKLGTKEVHVRWLIHASFVVIGVNRNSHSIERLQKSILVTLSFISNQLAAVMITNQKVLLISVTPRGLSNTVRLMILCDRHHKVSPNPNY